MHTFLSTLYFLAVIYCMVRIIRKYKRRNDPHKPRK